MKRFCGVLVLMVCLLAGMCWLPAAGAPIGRLQATADSPAAVWSFDENEGNAVADASGNHNAGMLQSGATREAGLAGAHALRLPPGSRGFVDVPTPVVDTSRSYTAMAWVRVNAAQGYQTFVSIDGEQVSGFFLQLRDDTGQFAFTSLARDAGGEGVFASASGAVQEGRWYHLAGVHDAAARTLTLYVNGVRQESVPFTNPWRAGGHTVIGRGKYDGNAVDFVGGAIDDVRLYQAALPASEIRAIAQVVRPPNQSDEPPAPVAPPVLQITADKVAAPVSPLLYGLMTEEINYSYDGGLYAELIRNRAFQDSPDEPAHWSLVQEGGANGAIALDSSQPLNAALPASLKLTVTNATNQARVGVANDGYWGIPVRPNTRYRASLFARADGGFTGPLTVSLESGDGKTTYARAQIPRIGSGWQRYTTTLTTGRVTPTADARFVVAASRPGTVFLNLVSLFPPTYKNRPNGLRPDLMQMLAALKPAFLRFPGGNYLEGDTIETRFDWKKTLGPLEQRPGHPGPWRYRSSDGMGLLEFLQWCEDLNMEPLLGVYAGYSLRQQHVDPGPALTPFVQDALDEIEYITGDKSTPWGARRARDGHPAPFKLRYVEIGNEDWFDRSRSYDGRFAQFYDAIKAKYPSLKLIATTRVSSRTPDVMDDHFYRSSIAL